VSSRKSSQEKTSDMRRRFLTAVGVVAVAFALIFFFAPAFPMNIVPCFLSGSGYASLSYRLFYAGEIYLGGHFEWATFNDQGCH
jgi:Sec-independent protein secretion pathway component TatC